MLISQLALAGSASWNLNPANGQWNKAGNWTPRTIPNGPNDVATFAVSNITAVSVADATAVDSITFAPGASAFTIEGVGPNLTFSGAGVINNSGLTQNFLCTTTNVFAQGLMTFSGSASAGDGSVFTANGDRNVSHIQFLDAATAGSSSFVAAEKGSANGEIDFYGNASAANGTFSATGSTNPSGGGDGGSIIFYDTSTAANGVFNTYASDVPLAGIGGHLRFYDSATAADSTITTNGSHAGGSGFSYTSFDGNSTAGNAHIINAGGLTGFCTGGNAGNAVIVNEGSGSITGAGTTDFCSPGAGDATITSEGSALAGGQGGLTLFFFEGDAENSTLIANGGPDLNSAGSIRFEDRSVGGTARVILSGNGKFDISNHNADSVIIGSVEGEGEVYLGKGSLAIGNNNLSTILEAIVQDRGYGGGTGGSLTKIGADSSLELSGANTYTGGTTVSAGSLIVNNTTGSGAGTGPVNVNGGTLGGSGTIAGPVTVGIGSGTGAFLAPAVGTNKKLTLTVQSALTLNSDAIYAYTFRAKSNKARSDLVIANGVTVNGAAIDLSGQTQGSLRQGLTLTVINNTGAESISGTFSNLADGSIVSVNGNNLQASYEGGDGNDLTLTVVP